MPNVAEELASLREQSLAKTHASNLKDANGLSAPEQEEAQIKDLNERKRVTNYTKEAKQTLNAGGSKNVVDQDLEFKRQLAALKKEDKAKQNEAKQILASSPKAFESPNNNIIKSSMTNGYHHHNNTTTASSTSHSKLTDFGPHVPEDKVQYRVQTPYGEGLTLRTRKASNDSPNIVMRQIELVQWKTAAMEAAKNNNNKGIVKPAMLYSTAEFPSVSPMIDDEVMCTYGRGKVTEIRVSSSDQASEDGPSTKVSTTTIVVLLSSWRLANRSRVKCYLQPSAVRVVRSKKIYEMTVHERVEAAMAFKDQAAKSFAAKDYQSALQSYAKAIDAVRYVQHKQDSDNYVRADLLVLMVTCTNNAGMCARHLGHWEESSNFGKNSEVLLDAVERKKGLKIHTILVNDGYHDVKVFGEWKIKSLILQARALAEKHEFDKSIDLLKKSHDIIASYSTDEYAEKYPASVKTLRNLEKEVKKLHAGCKERKAVALKKEKQRAAAMFGGSSSPRANSKSFAASQFEVPTVAPTNNGTQKENHVPNGSANNVSQSSAKNETTKSKSISRTFPLKDASESIFEEIPTENVKGRSPKRRVSFSEKVTAFEIPGHDMEDKDDSNNNKNHNNIQDEDELEWYKDQEVLLGLAFFGGAVVASSIFMSYLLRQRGS